MGRIADRALDGRLVTIPNSKFSDTPVENVSLEPSRKVVLNLGLTYDTTPEKMQQAMDLLTEISQANRQTEDNFTIAFNEFGDFAMNIMFIYYICKGESIADTQTAINMEILRKFNEAGLEFAYPTQTLYNITPN